MKKFCIVTSLAIVCLATSAGSVFGQCKVEDIFEKYKTDNRCNTVTVSKEMLSLIATQRNNERLEESVKNISNVKILTVKVPSSSGRSSSIYTFSHSKSRAMTTVVDGEVFVVSSKDSSDKQEQVRKAIREKKEKIDTERKKKVEDMEALKESIASAAASCIDGSKYTELMSINSDGKKVKYYAKKEAEKIKEFIAITNSKRECSIIIIKGDDIKIGSVSRLSEIIPDADIEADYFN